MLPRRLPICRNGIRNFVFKQYSSDSGKTTPPDEIVNESEKKHKADSQVTDKISLLLKGMLEDNAKRGSEPFKSKFPIDNQGFKSQKETRAANNKDEQEVILKAAAVVAESLGDEGKQIESDLVSKVLDIQNPAPVNWSELISGMNVDLTQSAAEPRTTSRAEQVHSALSKRGGARQSQRFTDRSSNYTDHSKQKRPQIKEINLFGGQLLEIFKEVSNNNGTELKLWDYLKENELKIIVTHPPSNHFQKLIMWTNEGKLWKFPIDNEQGMTAESDVHFSEHIFMENLLEDWCPRKGPVRHFMELVCVGLSKNAYIPIHEKREHIAWFRDYFDTKKELLQQVGALPVESSGKSPELSQ